MIRDSRFVIRDSRFTVHGSRFTVHGSRFTVLGSRFSVRICLAFLRLLKIAQRFSAGVYALGNDKVPSGTTEAFPDMPGSGVPEGTTDFSPRSTQR